MYSGRRGLTDKSSNESIDLNTLDNITGLDVYNSRAI